MKNLKKIFAVALTVAMLATMFMVPVFADAHDSAEKLETLGILVGAGQGVTPEYLAGPATRIVSAILLLKLTGMIGDAEMWNGTENFADADEAASMYAKTIMGYLKENPDVGFVGYLNKFMPNDVISAQMYYKVLLTALGYEQGVDFEWADVIAFAESKELSMIADTADLTINDFAIATVEALNAEVKGTGMTLIEKLVDDGVVSEEDAEAAGWVITPELDIVSAAQTSTNKIAVTFTTSVPAGAAIQLKQGVVIWYATVAWNTDRTVATLTTASNPLPAGTYTVVVTGGDVTWTKDVAVTAPVASSIAITTEIIYEGSTEIEYAIYNQFGEAMAVGPAVGSAYNQTDMLVVGLTPVGNTKFQFAAQTKNDVVVFTLTYMGMTASKTFTAQANPAASSIAFGTVAPKTGDAYIFVSKTGYVIPYSMFDQYGVAKKLPANDATAATMTIPPSAVDNFVFISSNPAIVDVASMATDANSVLTFSTGATAGTVLITAVWNAQVVGQLSITVSAAASPASAAITAPTTLVSAGQSVSVDIVVTDQFGTVHANDSAAVQALNAAIVATNCTATIDATTKKLVISNTVAGTATVVIKNGATTIGTLSFTVYPVAVASSVTAINTPTVFEVGATDAVAIADVTVLDQYGRAFTPAAIAITEVSDASNVVNAAGTTITATATAGTATLRVTADGNPLASHDFTVTVIASASITGYTLAPMGPIQVSADPAYFAHAVLQGVYGTSAVVLADQYDYDALTSSNLAVAIPNALHVQGVGAGTATITVWEAGVAKASGTVTVVNQALVATSVTIVGTATAGDQVNTVVIVKDQFGVVMANVGTYYVNGGVVAGTFAMPAGTHTIAFLTSNGVYKSGTVVVSAP